MAGHALAVSQRFPDAVVVGVEPDTANDFERSLAAGARVRVDKPTGICDGLLSYDVGEHCWPLLHRHVTRAVTVTDQETKQAMRWLQVTPHHALLHSVKHLTCRVNQGVHCNFALLCRVISMA